MKDWFDFMASASVVERASELNKMLAVGLLDPAMGRLFELEPGVKEKIDPLCPTCGEILSEEELARYDQPSCDRCYKKAWEEGDHSCP